MTERTRKREYESDMREREKPRESDSEKTEHRSQITESEKAKTERIT